MFKLAPVNITFPPMLAVPETTKFTKVPVDVMLGCVSVLKTPVKIVPTLPITLAWTRLAVKVSAFIAPDTMTFPKDDM